MLSIWCALVLSIFHGTCDCLRVRSGAPSSSWLSRFLMARAMTYAFDQWRFRLFHDAFTFTARAMTYAFDLGRSPRLHDSRFFTARAMVYAFDHWLCKPFQDTLDSTAHVIITLSISGVLDSFMTLTTSSRHARLFLHCIDGAFKFSLAHTMDLAISRSHSQPLQSTCDWCSSRSVAFRHFTACTIHIALGHWRS
jgi:hypothetical protein